ncbi:MAG: preprotein translocase subunit SecA [Clostridia bacterium]
MKENYGHANAKAVKQLDKLAQRIELIENDYVGLADDELRAKTDEFRERVNKGESLDSLLPEAFAVCREASKRVLHQRHYHVQLMGGIALHQGRICQMATGEGKTLTETLPAYLNALLGKGVHIVTVNEYLASRDAEWMGKVFKFLGLTVGVTLNKMTTREKQDAYLADITYGTNNEFGFDYLRDNMATSSNALVQRDLNFVIIDEVDSILIDEARTPLIISGRSGKSSEMYISANRFAKNLTKETDYTLDEKDKAVILTDEGMRKAENFFKVENLSDIENTELNMYINNALRANVIMKRDSDYIVDKGEIMIVDEFTGRKMEGRRYSGGLHQAIEAKENLRVKEENRTLATITFQNFFRTYAKMSGMTGTAKTEEAEFNSIYNVDVVVIPTNLPMIRQDFNDIVFSTREAKLNNIVAEIAERHATGQPLLVGTITVEKSEELSARLVKSGIKHNVLNAKNHQREAEIVAQAGKYGAVTIATNMAGRGTDILLGGNAEFLAKQDLMNSGVSAEDVERATSYAEGDSETEALKKRYREFYEIRKKETDEEHNKVVEAGGLCVIGTERHESRRIDNQLRGRSGRQGDPGASVFFMSMEDDMLRIFGGEKMQTILNFMHIDPEMPIDSKMLTKLIESSQMKIEDRNFSARKYVLQYDDVNNMQRKVIYRERRKVLLGEDVHTDILAMADNYARKALEEACGGEIKPEKWKLEEVNKGLLSYFPIDEDLVTEAQAEGDTAKEIKDALKDKVVDLLDKKVNESNEDGIDYKDLERFILLRVIDQKWMDHLDAMEQMKQGIGLQAIGQHDPVAMYKKEAYEMFDALEEDIEISTIKHLFFSHFKRVVSPVVVAQDAQEANPNMSFNKPCPCGSGKKYKDCCGKKLAENAKEEWRKNKQKRS